MPSFPDTLRELMERDPTMTQERLKTLSGINTASISLYLSGKRFPLPEPLAKLVCSISTDRDIRIQLMVAYLRDIAELCHIAGFDDRHYTIEAKGMPVAGLGTDIELLAQEAAKHEDIRAILASMADLVRRGQDAANEADMYRLAIAADGGDASTADQIVLAEVNRRASSSQRNAAS